MDEFEHWLKAEKEQDFSDGLNEYLARRLFVRTPRDVKQVRVVGSHLRDWHAENASNASRSGGGLVKSDRLVVWGGCAREIDGLCSGSGQKLEILSVRGPVSASELRLGAGVPTGDPSLVLPALYTPRPSEIYAGKTLCIPHFKDRRTDEELIAASGADLVLRPNIDGADEAVEAFLDAMCAARFVLSAALHPVILAAAYKVPFAFWDSFQCVVDEKARWRDFAESVGVPAVFVQTLLQGAKVYDEQIARNLKLPSLWRALVRSPYLLNAEAVLRILRHDLSGLDQEAIGPLLNEKIEHLARAREHFSGIANESRALINRLMRRAWDAEQLAGNLAERDDRIRELSEKAEGAWRELLSKDARIDAAWQQVVERDAQLRALNEELVKVSQHSMSAWATVDAMRNSRSWRITAPYRAVGAIVKAPGQMLGSSGILFRSVLGVLMLLPATVYSGGLRAAYASWRRTPNFASEVFSGQHQIRAGLDGRPTWLRHLVLASFSAGYRLYTTGSVSRTIGGAIRIVRNSGWQGIVQSLRSTLPVAGPADLSEDEAEAIDVPVGEPGSERRALVVDYRIPRGNVSAGERATVGIIRDLASIGFDVTFVPNDMLPSTEYEAELRALNVKVITRDLGFDYAAHYVDAHGAEFGLFYVFRYDVAENVLRSIRNAAPAARVIFHAPDLYFLRETRQARVTGTSDALARAEQTRRREVAIMNQSDHVVLVSPAEIPYLREALGADKPISVFPVLYAPIEREVAPFNARKDIFFLGGFGHNPNISAVEWFVEHVWPLVRQSLPDASFHIVGAEAPESVLALERTPGVKVVGFVPDLKQIFSAYRIGVAPLLYGAGIKGKVAATLGAGIPCVCTEIAAEGMGIENEVHALVEADAARFAAAVVRLYTDEALWTRLAANGQALVEAKFGEVANRGALLRVLNEARALPLALWQEYCERTPEFAVPSSPADSPIDVTIIVPAYNKWPLTRTCIASIVAASAGSGIRYEVILADDASSDETTQARQLIPGLRVVRTPGNLGFLRNCNNAAAQARGRYILLLNNDTVVLPGWLGELVETMDRDESIAIAGSKLLYPNGNIQEAGGGLHSNADGVSIGRWYFVHGSVRPVERDAPVFNFERETDYVTGASIIVRSTFWRQMGGFDTCFKNAYCEDSDLAMSARAAGFRVVYQPRSEVVHLEHQSYSDAADARRAELQRHNKELLLKKWQPFFTRNHLPVGHGWWEVAARGERAIPHRTLERRRKTEGLNILYFSPFPSHPSNHGNQATIQQFARRLQAMGHKVHFVLLRSSLYDDDALEAMKEAWDTLDVLPNSHPLGANGEEIPFDSWYWQGTGERIRTLCARYDIDVVLCSYVFQSKMLEYIPSYILRIIDTHDKMGDRYEMLRRRGLPLEFFSCTPEEEGAYLRRADVVFARRQEEAAYFNSVTGRNSAIVVPHFEEPHFAERSFSGGLHKVAIVASANRINLAIVRDFLQAIDRRLGSNESPVQVLVAGQVKDMVASLPSKDKAVFGRRWVRMLGFVENIDEFYNSADLVVSPVTIGTGINVKTVQAMAYGMPLLTTSWGSKGIETSEPLHNLESLDALIDAMFELVDHPRRLDDLASSSRHAYQRFLDSGVAGMRQALELVPRSRGEDFTPAIVSSLEEWRATRASREARKPQESAIAQNLQASSGPIEIRATCSLCGIGWMTCAQYDGRVNWRETVICPHCELNGRMRASMHLLGNSPLLRKDSRVYITERKTRLFEALRSSLFPSLIGSEYLGDRCPRGAEFNGLRNEDLTRLTFGDGELDAILTFDVLEHVPDYKAALHEIFRCLRPGGSLMATAPFNPESFETVIRAQIKESGEVEYLLPAEYHGDPMNSEQGVLCFQTFGWDLLDEMRVIGFSEVQMADCWSPMYGYFGQTLVLIATKPMTGVYPVQAT